MSSRSTICGVPIGIYSFFYIITYFIKNVKCNRHFGSIWIGVRLWRIPYVDPAGSLGFGIGGDARRPQVQQKKFAYGVLDRKFGTWPPTRARRTLVRSNICSRLVVPNLRALKKTNSCSS
jgi:hypothetical protein